VARCTFEQFSEFFREFVERNIIMDSIIDRYPNDVQIFIMDNDYINEKGLFLDKVMDILVGDSELMDLVYWYQYDSSPKEIYYKTEFDEKSIPVDTIERFLEYVQKEYFA
jgi:galactose-1-phosphate uridylyltransferase